MASPIPDGFNQYVDNRGNPISNGTVSYFHPGTTTPKPTWRDPAQMIINNHPIVLDSNGRAPIFGAGRYRQQVRSTNGNLLFDGETSLGEADLPLAGEIAALTIDGEVQQIATCGFSVAGKGAARYARLAAAPAVDEQAAGLNRWLFTSNGGTVWWRLAEPEPTDLMFGVLATASVSTSGGTMTVSGPDDTAALQAAIDHVLYFGKTNGRRLRMPAGLRRITNTIHIGYGDRYLDWQVIGDGARGFDANAGYHSGLIADFNDRPAINIQAARLCRLDSLAVLGCNHAWMVANESAIADRAVLASWRGPQMQSAGVDTRYAPYCGIAIDGYSGTRQAASSYPDASYPAWLGATTQYDKAASSEIKFRDVAAQGFEVGLALQPNLMPVASNGDFMSWTDCDLGLNLVGLAVAHSDARAIAIDRCRFHGCRTAIDGLSYGGAAPNLAAQITNSSFDRVWRVFHVDLGISAQPFAPCLILSNFFAEGIHSLGLVRSANAVGRPGSIRFIGGEIGFALRSGEYSPTYYLSGPGVRARFEEVSIHGTYGLFAVECDLAECSVTMPAVAQQVFDVTNLGGRRAASALCGIDAPRITRAAVNPFAVYALDNSTWSGLRVNSHGWDFTAAGGAASGLYVPLFARSVDFAGYHAPIGDAPQEVLDRAAFPLSNLTQSGIEWTFSVAGGFLADSAAPDCAIGRGDIVRDEATGTLYYVRTASFAGSGATLVLTLTLRQLTGVRSNDGITWNTAQSLVAGTGVLRFRCARRVMPGARRRMALNTTAGSGSVSLVAVGPETFAPADFGAIVSTISVGDYFLPADRGAATIEESTFAKARVTSVVTSGGQPTGVLMLDAAARRGGMVHAPLIVKAV